MGGPSWTVIVVALFLVAELVLDPVAGQLAVTPETVAKFEDVPMITMNETLLLSRSSSSSRHRRRRLATGSVWCISLPNISIQALDNSLNWACGPQANQGQVNCGPISTAAVCFDPDTFAHHCDWAFNSYFNRMNGAAGTCNFSGTAQQVSTDPSSGTCIFPATIVELNSTTPGAPPSTSPSPNGSPVYGPSAATLTLQPHHLFSVSTAVMLLTYLFT